jgi:SSS family solute:Na+ symporter
MNEIGGIGFMTNQAGMSLSQGIVAVVLFFLITMATSFFASKVRSVNSLEEYLISGRRVPWPLTTAVLVSAWIFTSSTMGAAESALSFGASGLWMYAMYGLSLLTVGLIIPRFKNIADKLGINSLTEFVRNRLDMKNYYVGLVIIWLGSFLTLLFNIGGAGFVISALTEGKISYVAGVIILAVITLIYVLMGGFWSTAITSWVLALICSLGVVSSIPYIINGAGGLPQVVDAAQRAAQHLGKPETVSLFNPEGAQVFLLATVLYGFSAWAVQEWYQPGIASNQHNLRTGYLMAFVWVVLITVLSGGIGFIGFALVNSGTVPGPASPSEIYPYLTVLFAPKWVQFLMLFLVFGAGSGTVAVNLMSQSTLLQGAMEKSGKGQKVTLSQVRVYIIIAILVAIAVNIIFTPSVLFMVLLACTVYASMGVPMLLAIFWSKVNNDGMFWGVLLGEIAALVLFFVKSPGEGTLWGTLIGGGVTVIWSLLSPKRFDLEAMRNVEA